MTTESPQAAQAGVPFHVIWLEAPTETMTERVVDRVDDASDATAEVVARQTCYEIGKITWTRIKNDAGPNEACRKAWDLLTG